MDGSNFTKALTQAVAKKVQQSSQQIADQASPKPTRYQYGEAAAQRTNRVVPGMKSQRGGTAMRLTPPGSGPAKNQINWGHDLEKKLTRKGITGEVTWKQSKKGWRAVGPKGKVYKPPPVKGVSPGALYS